MDSAAGSSNALVRKRTDTDLMPPPPPAKKIKRPKKVLEEDAYTEALSQIIARDFFPGLLETQIQQEYLHAIESKDAAWISSASRRLRNVMTPGRKPTRSASSINATHGSQTPTSFVGDTPASMATSVAQDKPKLDVNMSLSAFQATYTSEDNESFYKLIDKQNQKRADKYAWLWRGNKLPSKQMIKQKEVTDRLEKTRSLVDDGFKRDLLAIRDVEERPARPDSWNAAPRNGLMFEPEGLEDGVKTVAQSAEEQSRMAPRAISYENTRMPQPHVPQRPPSPTMSSIRDAISGKPRQTDLDSSIVGGGETPRVNGYAFVDDEDGDDAAPLPAPINLGPGDATNPFKIQDQRKRELLHERMVERIAKSKSDSLRRGFTGKESAMETPRFTSGPRASGGLTPAAQRLWSKMATPLKGKAADSKIHMGFVDFAIDLAAVLNASRSVASKHVALRGRQLDVYSRTSSVGALLRKTKAAGGATQAGDPGRNGSGHGSEAVARGDVGEKTSESVASSSSPSPVSEGLKVEDLKIQEAPRTSSASTARDQDRDKLSEELGLPPGADINIFHTARGSQILGSLRRQQGPAKGRREAAGGGPGKEHPLRYWPRPPPIEADAAETAPSEPLNTAAESGKGKKESPLDTGKLDAETVEAVKEAFIPETAPASVPSYQLRESKVPATRFSRILNYGGLAAGMLGGAVTESVSRAFGGGGEGSVLLSGGNMERLVAKLSRMRGAALKLGQMMSFQDSKMLPAPIQEVLQRVQDRADYMPAWQRDRVLASNLGSDWRDLFSEFEEKPIAAASIGQVHKAVLKSNGKRVAVKIQFPGVADSINSDLDNLGILLTATKLLPKGLYLNKTIDNARLELGWECDYVREAECAKRFKELLRGEEDVFEAPDVYPEASGKQVLTMDFLDGVGVTRVKSFTQEQRDWIGTQILRLCLREITEFKFMQTDPNWTNFLYNAKTNKLELLDFGASREYPEEFISQYVQLLEAASRSDRDGVKKFSEGLGYLTGHESRTMLDAHVQSVLTLAEPFLASAPEVYDFKDQTITERVKALIPVMLHERLAPPPEETYSLHRKLSGAFLLCARLESKVRCRELFANSVAKSGYVQRV
ncbi:putative molecular chaperone [Trichoderma citrinoviride]|uniref:Putative molecular chaperone n=1 Tax=Trichoderma citrinoviride TaxID=58853 RepID=A0A2T4B0I4_9HYPO|nr:putative molecular chaperone [Trichoderma citrinoviride]PTB62810.1 putative molecular chaperone [Trichoderma citrinoviride]